MSTREEAEAQASRWAEAAVQAYRSDQLADAEKGFRGALEIRRRLAQAEPETYEPILATTLNALSLILRRSGRLGEAEETILEALRIRRTLAGVEPPHHEAGLAESLVELAEVLEGLGRMEEAEHALRDALEIRLRLATSGAESDEFGLVVTLSELGTVLQHLRRLEEAEAVSRQALDICRSLAALDPETYDSALVGTLNELGKILVGLRRLEEAKEIHLEVLELARRLAALRPESADPNLSMALNNLAGILVVRGQLDEAEGLLQEALDIRRRLAAEQPVYEPDVARALTSLGVVLRGLHRLEEAEEALQEAAEIYRRLTSLLPEIFGPNLALTLINLGTVLQDLERLSEAESVHREAAGYLPRDDRPVEHQMAVSNLGRVLLQAERWEEAAASLRDAVGQIELLRSEGLSLDRRLAILRENIDTYEAFVIALMKLGRWADAMEAAEQGKSRTLVDLLTLRDLRPRNAPEAVVREYEQTLFRARALEDQLHRRGPAETEAPDRPGLDPGQVQEELSRATGRLLELTREIGTLDPDFLPHAAPLAHVDIIALAREAEATFVLFRVTRAGTYVFLVFPDGPMEAIEVTTFASSTLARLLVEAPEGDQAGAWVLRYREYKTALASVDANEAACARERWLQAVDETLRKLYAELLQPVHEVLQARLPKESRAPLVLVPNRGLAILPLHACWWEEQGARRYLLDEFSIRYAPSLSIFKRCLERERAGRRLETLLAVSNPDPPGDLVFSEWECDEIERLLGSEDCLVLRGSEARREEARRQAEDRDLLHFSCHAQYLPDRPLDSALHLAGGETLTMGDIFEGLSLPRASLVSLSACETGLVDFREVADEHYGLPVAFLYAGAPTVYASLWAVNDLSTALLMGKAYEGVVGQGKVKAEALRDAQVWLRELTAGEATEQLAQREAVLAGERLALADLTPMRRRLEFAYEASECPFSHPHWWAAFQCVGA